MATPQLKRHQAVVWLPPRSIGERAFGSEPRLVAQIGGESPIVARPVSLDALDGVRQVSLVADPRDVTLIETAVPPLSGARLRQALPGLVEEYLLQDAGKCLIVPGPAGADGTRLIAVIDRDWVEFVIGAFARRQVRVDRFWPAQLVLPYEDDGWSLAIAGSAITLRTGERGGFGWSAPEESAEQVDAISAALDAAGVRDAPPARLLAWVDAPEWQLPVQQAAERAGLDVDVAPLPLVRGASIDLMLGRGAGMKASLAQVDWRLWRAPALLAAACLAVFLVGLNVHWGMQRAEQSRLRAAMVQKFRTAFPGQQAIVDPLLQMKRNVAALRAQAGRAGPEDFVPMFARVAQALGPQAMDGLAAVEFREGAIKVRFKQELVAAAPARDQLRQSFARLGLLLQFDNERDPTARITVRGA